MKKPKVKLIEFSPKNEDGLRETLNETIICTCNARGDAELIRSKLRDVYSNITSIDDPNSRKYSLVVGY